MATGNTDSFIPSTKEYEVLQMYFGKLTDAITNPVRLAADLFAADLISTPTRRKANNETSSQEIRNHHILNELMVGVALDSTKLMDIISVLQQHPPLLRDIAEKMKTECETTATHTGDEQQILNKSTDPSTTTTTQPQDKQHVQSGSTEPPSTVTTTEPTVQNTLIVGDGAYYDLSKMLMRLGILVQTIQEEVKSADIEFIKIKQLLVLSYPFEEEINRAENLSDIFLIVCKLCSPINIDILILLVDYFKLSDALKAIQTYEVEEQNYCKRVLSTTFAKQLKKETETLGHTPTSESTIPLTLKWSRAIPSTVNEFEIVIKNLFINYSQYIHIYKVDKGCIFVTMCAPKPLMGALVKMAKTRQPYLLDIGVILLQIGNEVILDKKESVPEDHKNVDNSTERKEVIHTEVYQDQPLPVDNSSIISTNFQTAPQQQSQVPKLEKDVTDAQRRDEEVRALKKEIEELRQQLEIKENKKIMEIESVEEKRQIISYKPTGKYDLLIIGSFGKVSDSQTIQVAHKLIPKDQEGSNQWMTKEIDCIREKHHKSDFCQEILVCEDLPETEQSRDYYLKKIRNFLTNCKQEKALIFYTGNGEKDTGNWCFRDGVIAFQDIFNLYMAFYKGKKLTINSDCSYSGNWVKDCAKTLDGLSIPSCGHHTKEKEILFNIWSSCDVNENATALCYVNEAIEFDETNKTVVTAYHKKLSSGQTTKLVDFRQIRCNKAEEETCEVDPTYTWEDRMFHESQPVHLVHSIKWHYVLVNKDKVETFKALVQTGTIDVANYGTVLHSGWGKDPPEDIKDKVHLRYMMYTDVEVI